MKNSPRSTQLNSLLLLLILLCVVRCNKKNDPAASTVNSFPKSVSIEYKITPSNGITTASTIIYTNETGGTTLLTNQPLPFTKKINRIVNRFDALSLLGEANTGGGLKLDILVDGALADTKTGTGSTMVSQSLVYIFQ